MTKKDLKKIVNDCLDFSLFHGKRSFNVEDYEYTFTMTTYDNTVSEVQLKFPYGELRCSTSVDNRKDIARFFTDFIWKMFVNYKELKEVPENGSNQS